MRAEPLASAIPPAIVRGRAHQAPNVGCVAHATTDAPQIERSEQRVTRCEHSTPPRLEFSALHLRHMSTKLLLLIVCAEITLLSVQFIRPGPLDDAR